MNHFQSLKTLSYVQVRRILRIWIQTIIPPAITTALYLLIFGELIGSRIGEMPGYEGLTYLEFMVPGLIMLAVITNSYANVASAFFGAKFQKAIEEILISPMANWAILLGFIVGGIARGVLVGVGITRSSTDDVKLLKNAPIPQGSSLEFMAGNKVVLETTDTLTVNSDTNNSIDASLTIMEIT